MTETELTNWIGPFAMPGYEAETGLPSLPKNRKGVYITTVETSGGYLVIEAGRTHDQSHYGRWQQHTQNLKKGSGIILDSELLAQGINHRVWKQVEVVKAKHRDGDYYWKQKSYDKSFWELDWKQRKDELMELRRKHHKLIRIFVTDISLADTAFTERMGERLEAAIMYYLWNTDAPVANRGRMALSRRRRNEEPITFCSNADDLFYDLPGKLEF